MNYVLEAACVSDIGRVRANNEDNLFFDGRLLPQDNSGIQTPWQSRVQNHGVCFGVFDGMGGAADGQVASYYAASVFAAACRQDFEQQPLDFPFFSHTVAQMNSVVAALASENGTNMGTTAVMLGFQGEQIFVCNVGDSRAFQLRGETLTQITLDHVEQLPPQSKRKKPRLTQCVGMDLKELLLEPYLACSQVRAEDVYLLCSDGVTDMVPESEISSILRENRPAQAVLKLRDAALQAGGRDNTTLIVCRVTQDETAEHKNTGKAAVLFPRWDVPDPPILISAENTPSPTSVLAELFSAAQRDKLLLQQMCQTSQQSTTRQLHETTRTYGQLTNRRGTQSEPEEQKPAAPNGRWLPNWLFWLLIVGALSVLLALLLVLLRPAPADELVAETTTEIPISTTVSQPDTTADSSDITSESQSEATTESSTSTAETQTESSTDRSTSGSESQSDSTDISTSTSEIVFS